MRQSELRKKLEETFDEITKKFQKKRMRIIIITGSISLFCFFLALLLIIFGHGNNGSSLIVWSGILIYILLMGIGAYKQELRKEERFRDNILEGFCRVDPKGMEKLSKILQKEKKKNE